MSRIRKPGKSTSINWWGYLVAIGLVILTTWLKYLAQPTIIPADEPMPYLLAIVPAAIFFGYGPSILACILSVLAFDFFFNTPLYTFITVSDIQNMPIIVIFLLVGLLLSYFASNLYQKSKEAVQEIAARKQAEAELSEYRDHLEAMVRQRTTELEKAILDLEQNITERKQMGQKLEEMATHDFLTGLPNRILLLDRFNIAAALAHRNKARLAVMSLDLDRFKSINDTLGHDAGDQVLKTISTRLTGIIRASDTLARVGGDEFMLLMMETNQREDATAIAQKILDSFREPLAFDGQQLVLSISIGVAIYPDDAEDLESLTKKSDAAMYYSKGHGRNQFKFFSDGDVLVS